MWSGRKKARRKLRSNSFPASKAGALCSARISRKVFPGTRSMPPCLPACSLAVQAGSAQWAIKTNFVQKFKLNPFNFPGGNRKYESKSKVFPGTKSMPPCLPACSLAVQAGTAQWANKTNFVQKLKWSPFDFPS